MNRFFFVLFLPVLLPPLCAIRTSDAATPSLHARVTSEARSDLDHLDAEDAAEAREYLRDLRTEETSPSASDPLLFARACEAGRRVVIGAVGDVLLHKPLAVQGMSHVDGFRSLWKDVEPWISGVNFAYANLEGPAAGAVSKAGVVVADPGKRFDDIAYTSYPQFNYHPDLIPDLRASGIDIVSTANNHSLDRRSLGIDRTVAGLEKHALPFTGTLTAAAAERDRPENANWSTITERDGFRIAWIACAYGTNGIPDPRKQVLQCFSQRTILLDQIRRLRADPTIDAVVATPHWGTEYTHVPGADQRRLAREMVDAGAAIIFGAHPHVLQPAEKITAADGREAYIIYSLGNFVSGQKGIARRSSAMAFVGLTKNARGEVFVNGARHLPLAMTYGRTLMAKPAFGNDVEARTLANRVLVGSRELLPTDSMVTNPECARSGVHP